MENEKRDVVSSMSSGLTETAAGFRILQNPDVQIIMFVPDRPSGAYMLTMILNHDHQVPRASRTTLLFDRSGRAADDPTRLVGGGFSKFCWLSMTEYLASFMNLGTESCV